MSTDSLPSSAYLNAMALTLPQTKLRQLLSQYSSPEHVWTSINERPSLLPEKVQKSFIERKESVNVETEWRKLLNKNISLITYDSDSYPALLKSIHSPPITLFIKGNIETLSKPSLAVVGTRSHSVYGKEVVERIVPQLAQAGLSIVSGLAQGIDTLAHVETLRVGGSTCAVLGCGIDFVESTPSRRLAEKIIEQGGAIVSEYPLGMPPLKQHFPARNRIIAGIASGTLVIESRFPGGSLITAQHALDEGREVFAIPGPITGAASEGTNRLIQDGAHAVTSAEDILDILSIEAHTTSRILPIELSKIEQKIMDSLELQALYIDEIVRQTSLTIQEANAHLTALELKGLVKNIGGNIYQRLR